jgi:pyruvate dehydrogenase (quinone)
MLAASGRHLHRRRRLSDDVGPHAISQWRRLLGSFNHGSMANAMPQAMGAQLTFPGRQVISLSGDGGFSLLTGDFLTIRQLQLPVKSSSSTTARSALSSWRWRRQACWNTAPPSTILISPMAETVGMRGIRVEDPSEVSAAIQAALAHDGAVLIDAVVNRHELSMPPKIQLDQAKGFTLDMLRRY